MDGENTQVMVQNQKVQVYRENVELSVAQIEARVNKVHHIFTKIMKDKTHYGTIPGCGDKKVLLKPGADLLAMAFSLVPQFSVTKTDLPNGHKEFDCTCSMFAADGSLLCHGVGSASTMEKKYRYRNGSEHPDIADVYNTVLKMGKKRAQVDATLTATGAADIFTQDLIETEDEPERAPIKQPTARATVVQPKTPTAAPAQAKAATEVTSPTPASGDTVQGIVAVVTQKPGKSSRGDYMKTSIKLEDGDWYGTFSDTIGAEAKGLKGKLVEIRFTNDGKYNTMTGIVVLPDEAEAPPVVEESAPAAEVGNDNTPF